eukprot:scaffold44559_cov64-Phaeocystis_antarctica.AAC.1
MEVRLWDNWVLMTDATSFIPSRQGVGCMRTISLPTHSIEASVGPYPLYSVVDVDTRSSTADVSASPPTSIHSTDEGKPARIVKVQQRERVGQQDCRAAKRAQTKKQAELKRIKDVVGTQPIADQLRIRAASGAVQQVDNAP